MRYEYLRLYMTLCRATGTAATKEHFKQYTAIVKRYRRVSLDAIAQAAREV